MRAIAPKAAIHILQATNQVQHFPAFHGATGWYAEMGATAKGPALVDQTSHSRGIKHRTRSLHSIGKLFPAGCLPCAGEIKSLAFCEDRRFPGDLKLATLTAANAISLDGAGFQIPVDGGNIGQSCVFTLGMELPDGHRILNKIA
jgi:hypothetical protein